ncbi:MAG: response regulator [Terriglobales bacterium]
MAAHAKKKILVVDDSLPIMQTLVLVLRSAGFHAAGESSAAKGLETAKSHQPDILLCDVQLDGTTGVALSMEIAKCLPTCRIILMSGDTTAGKILTEAHERGQDFEVLAKPIPVEELLAALGPAQPERR